MTTYYDVVLGVIPLTFVAVIGVSATVGTDLVITLTAGSVLAAGLVGHALFVNPPITHPPTATDRQATPVSGQTESPTNFAD